MSQDWGNEPTREELIAQVYKLRQTVEMKNGTIRAQGNEITRLESENAELRAEVERLSKIAAAATMEHAPCLVCGYNGPGYFQPSTHPCAVHWHNRENILATEGQESE